MLLFLYRVNKILNEIARQFELRNLDTSYVYSTKVYLHNLNDVFPMSNNQKRDWFHQLNGIKKTLRRQKYSDNSVKAAISYFQLTNPYLINLLTCFQNEKSGMKALSSLCSKKHYLRMSCSFEEEQIRKSRERLENLKMPDKRQADESRNFKLACEKRLKDFENVEAYLKIIFLIPPVLNLLMRKYSQSGEDRSLLEKLYILLSPKNFDKIFYVEQGEIVTAREAARKLNSAMTKFEQDKWHSKEKDQMRNEKIQAALDVQNACVDLLRDFENLSKKNRDQKLAA